MLICLSSIYGKGQPTRMDNLKKISTPLLSRSILHRTELLNRLREMIIKSVIDEEERTSSYKLVVLCSPAGYGKTTLLVDFAQYTSLPCCWLFLEEADAEEVNFLQTLLLSFLYASPSLKGVLKPVLADLTAKHPGDSLSKAESDRVIEALVLAMTKEIPERFALFLCNYHAVNHSQKINGLVNRLLRKLPPQCVLVIESRAVPKLDFAPLLARDEMIGLDQHFLRFTSTDIRNLADLQHTRPLQVEEAEHLHRLFDGWIAGMLLGSCLNGSRIPHLYGDAYQPVNPPNIRIDKQKVFAYLVNEVFDRNLEVYAFLQKAAVLQKMTPTMCNALLECSDSADYLHDLEQHGLFVTRTNDDFPVAYICNPIVRELLCNELHHQFPEQFAQLHQQAMKLWSQAFNYEQAIYHAIEAQCHDEAAKLICEKHEQLFEQGREELLADWIDVLPPDLFTYYPHLFLVRANLYLQKSEYTRALPLLTRATETMAHHRSLTNGAEFALFQAAIALARSKALYQKGDYIQAQTLCQQILQQIDIDDVALRAEAYTNLGVCSNLLGIFHEGIAYFHKALQLWGREYNKRQIAELHTSLAGSYRLLGNLALAEHHLSYATKCWDCLQNEWGKVNNLIHAGQIKHQQGAFSEAEALFQQALTMARGHIHFLRGEAYALVSLGALCQDQGLYKQSLAFTEEGLALARRLKDRYLVNSTLCIQAITYLLMSDGETALLLVAEVDLADSSDRHGVYERAKHDLTLGMILLYREQYEEAYTSLLRTEKAFGTAGLHEDLLQATLYLAECEIKQGRQVEAIHRLNALQLSFQTNDAWEQFLRSRVCLLPALTEIVKTRPELIWLRNILYGEDRAKLPSKQSELLSRQPATEIIHDGAPQIKILALGEPSVLINGEAILRWRTKRATELFFLLLNNDLPLRKEQIITALWQETSERIDGTLHSTIYRLRKLLGEACVVSHAGTYALDLPSVYANHIHYDVATFQAYATQARQALEVGDDGDAKTPLLEMVDLYRGDYVQSFYSDWCVIQRTKLRLAYIGARQDLAQIAWRQELFDESVHHWQQILAIDDCLEEAHYGLMRCFLRQGKRGLVWRQYQQCVERLDTELGVKPGPAIQNLFEYLTKSSGTQHP